MLVARILNIIFVRPFHRARLKKIGTNYRIGPSSFVSCYGSIEVGDNFFTGPYPYISTNSLTKIVIGSNVMCGPYIKIIGGNHNISWPHGPMNNAPFLGGGKGIIIEDDVWLGAGVTVLDGAVITEGTVVAAGAVVTCKTIPYFVYGGVPAKPIKPRFTLEQVAQLNSVNYTRQEIIDTHTNMLVGK